jgi:Transposase DDE domain group 1
MGEGQEWLFEPTFNRSIKVRQKDQRLTSDAGVLLLREADHRLGLVASLAQRMIDPRDPAKVRYTLTELLRERLYALAQGYRAQDDLDRLAHDPALKMAVWDRPGKRVLDERLASQPTQSRLLDTLATTGRNRQAMREALADWLVRYVRSTGPDRTVRQGTVDVDGFPIEVHGEQPGGAYNGYYQTTIYSSLVASFSVCGDYDSGFHGERLGNGFVHALLRRGTAGSAEGALRFIKEVVRKCASLAYVLDLRLDAGFTHGLVMDYLTERKWRFLGRLQGNPVLDRLAEPYLKRPVGRPPKEGYEDVFELGMHQAESWKHPQRLLLVVIDQPDPVTGQLNLLPDYFFLVTNRPVEEISGEASLAHYRPRGTFEDRLGEFNATVAPRLSSPEFEENEATLLLAMLAFNLASMLRGELEDQLGGCWDLGRFQRSVLKAGARVVKGSRQLKVDLAQAVIPLWEHLLNRLRRWMLPARWSVRRVAARRVWVPPPRHAFLREVLRL